jgi:hypothetical protein
MLDGTMEGSQMLMIAIKMSATLRASISHRLLRIKQQNFIKHRSK